MSQAEPERSVKVIHSVEGCPAPAKLRNAVGFLTQSPRALHLRYLKMQADVLTSRRSSIVVVPLPLEVIKPLM